ncbi:MAG: hypothetical protein QOI12_2388 [Alphaproteobacteria bacterium]|jgi:hypothetical protein|nr:hypothetical protein [Alphaproteobacteria bacterium]
MADDNILRSYRDPSRRSTAPASAGEPPASSDPLAELARLIGQSDPFAQSERANGRGGSQRSAEHVAQSAPPTVPEWRKFAASQRPFEEVHEPPALQPDPYIAAADTGFARHDPYQMASTAQAAGSYAEADEADRRFEAEPRFADAEEFPAGGEPMQMAAAPRGQDDEPYYEDGEPTTQHDEAAYDDPPRPRRGSSLITALTLIGCAMIGTAGAYGYRSFHTGSVMKKTPPVISAETTPSKVVASNDAQSTKVIQDRIGGQAPVEKIVPREEQPIDVKPAGTSSTPRVVLPAPVAPQSPATFPAAPGATPSTTASSSKDEPKRVRTLTIRPDGTDLSGKPVTGISSSGPAAPAANARAAPAAKQTQTQTSRNGPLSLDPQTQASAVPPPPQARASVPPPETTAPAPRVTPPAPRLASAPSSGGSGGYVVQLSSQRSEAEAQASYRSLQAKFPGQLGSRSPLVRRADLGAKGVFYRAMVGPFASSGEADQFCGSLKAAGGQCIIQRN